MGKKSKSQQQNEQQQTQQNQVALLNKNLYSLVLTAGVNVNKFNRLAEKNGQQVDLLEVSLFVFDLVQSRTMPLDVTAKIVCGSCYIFLLNVQKLQTRLLVLDKQQFKCRKIGYKEKKVVRQFDVEVPTDKDGNLKLLPNVEEYFEVEFETEKDVLDALLASQQSTMVQNVEDITLRELPTIRPVEEYETLNTVDDFGEATSHELLEFCNDSTEQQQEPTALMSSEPTVTQDDLMDIEPSVEPELEANSDPNNHLLPLEDTMQPIPMEVGEEDGIQDVLQPLDSLDSFHGFDEESNNVEETPENPPTENTLEKEVKHEAVPVTHGKRSLVIVDDPRQLSYRCLVRHMAKCSQTTISLEELRQEKRAFLIEQKLKRLFAEPLRPFRHSFLYERNLTVRTKRKASFGDFAFNKRKSSKKDNNGCCTSNSNVQTDMVQTVAVPEEPFQLMEPIATVAPVLHDEPFVPCAKPTFNNDRPRSVESFLTIFTGDPSQWEYLKRTEEPHKQKASAKKDEGVVTSYALLVVLRSLFQEVGDEPIPFEMIQAKMGSRKIAASLFAKLLELSASKIIRIVTNQAGLPVMVHKFQNWN